MHDVQGSNPFIPLLPPLAPAALPSAPLARPQSPATHTRRPGESMVYGSAAVDAASELSFASSTGNAASNRSDLCASTTSLPASYCIQQASSNIGSDSISDGSSGSIVIEDAYHTNSPPPLPVESRIGFWAGQTLLIGSMTGPGLVVIPSLYQQAGWFPPTVVFIIAAIVSGFASMFLCEVLAAVPHNGRFQARVELATLLELVVGPKFRLVIHFWLFWAIQAINIASIIVSTQMMDSLIVAIFEKTCGVQLAPKLGWICVSGVSFTSSPFGSASMLFTLGFVLAAAIVIPLCFFNLVDNIRVQILSMFLLVFVCTYWIVIFARIPAHINGGYLPAFRSNQSELVGTVLFNYAYVTTVPSWVNVKKPGMSVTKSIWTSTVIATLLYIMLGIVSAAAVVMPEGSNILSVLQDVDMSKLSQATIFVFPFATLITSIPVYTTIVRYNLTSSRICRSKIAYALAIAVPWLGSIPFQTGIGLNEVINWTSLIFTAVVNFILPLLLYILFRRGYIPILRRRQTSTQVSLLGMESASESCPEKCVSSFVNAPVLAVEQIGSGKSADISEKPESVRSIALDRRKSIDWLVGSSDSGVATAEALETAASFVNEYPKTAFNSPSFSNLSSRTSLNEIDEIQRVNSSSTAVNTISTQSKGSLAKTLALRCARWRLLPRFVSAQLVKFAEDARDESESEPYIALDDRYHPVSVAIVLIATVSGLVACMFVYMLLAYSGLKMHWLEPQVMHPFSQPHGNRPPSAMTSLPPYPTLAALLLQPQISSTHAYMASSDYGVSADGGSAGVQRPWSRSATELSITGPAAPDVGTDAERLLATKTPEAVDTEPSMDVCILLRRVDLPQEILFQVLRWLPVSDLLACIAAGGRLNELALDGRLWRCIRSKDLDHRAATCQPAIGLFSSSTPTRSRPGQFIPPPTANAWQLTLKSTRLRGKLVDRQLRSLTVSAGYFLREADFTDCIYLQSETLATVAASCPFLFTLKLRGCHSISPASLRSALSYLPYLRKIDLSGLGAHGIINDDTFTELAAGGHLCDVDLSGFFSVAESPLTTSSPRSGRFTIRRGLARLIQRLRRNNLRRLVLRGVTESDPDMSVAEVASEAAALIAILATDQRHLTQLTVAGSPRVVTDRLIFALCHGDTKLQQLNICGAGRLTDSVAEAIESCQALRDSLSHLDISDCRGFTSSGLVRIVRACSRLQVLEMEDCAQDAVNDDVAGAIGAVLSARVRHWVAASAATTKPLDRVDDIAHMKSLGLGYAAALTVTGVGSLVHASEAYDIAVQELGTRAQRSGPLISRLALDGTANSVSTSYLRHLTNRHSVGIAVSVQRQFDETLEAWDCHRLRVHDVDQALDLGIDVFSFYSWKRRWREEAAAAEEARRREVRESALHHLQRQRSVSLGTQGLRSIRGPRDEEEFRRREAPNGGHRERGGSPEGCSIM